MHRVRWKRTARDLLAEAWLSSDGPLRNQITSASSAIDLKLARDPYADSESREAGQRIMIQPPLGVKYRVDDSTRTVYVLKVWLIKPRTS